MPGTRWCARFRLAVHSFSKISIVTSDIYVTNQLRRSCIIFKFFWTLLGAFKLFQSPSNFLKTQCQWSKFTVQRRLTFHIYSNSCDLLENTSQRFTGSQENYSPRYAGECSPRTCKSPRLTANTSPRYAGEGDWVDPTLMRHQGKDASWQPVVQTKIQIQIQIQIQMQIKNANIRWTGRSTSFLSIPPSTTTGT